MSEYVPTTEEVREYVVNGGEYRPWEEPDGVAEDARGAAFDRWLTQHDAKVAKGAKVEVANLLDTLYDEMGTPNPAWVSGIQSAKRAILASIEAGEGA